MYLFLILLSLASAQIPKDVPHPVTNTKLDLSNPADLIIYIILPVILIILYFIWRRKKNAK